MTITSPTVATPRLTRLSTNLLWFAFALALALQVIYADGNIGVVFNNLMKGLILVFTLHAYLIVGISKGRNSARWISLLLFVGGLFFAPPSIDGFESAPLTISTETAQVCAQCLAYIGLFAQSSNAWFKSVSANRSIGNAG